MKLQQLRYLAAIVESDLNITAAAERLQGITRETALRRLMGALQADPAFKGHGLHVFPRDGADGSVVYLDS